MSSPPPAVTARHWRGLADGRIECALCPRHCRLRDGERGFCFVRECRGGVMTLSTWGRSSGFCVDPIEKKPLYHFLPGTPVLSFGTAGCNLGCTFCQNWDISRAREADRLNDGASPGEIAEAAARLSCKSVAFTYNDPVIFLEYALDVAAACHDRGLKTVAVTAGYIEGKARAEFFAGMDAANVDLKSFSDDFYRRNCQARLAPVLETLEYLHHETDVWLEITTLLIPGENDSDAEIKALASFVARRLSPDVPLHFSAFHPSWRMTDRGATPPSTLARARDLAMAEGMRFVYVGNVRDPVGAATWCPECRNLLIGRDGFELVAWNLDEHGACRFCGAPIPGLFEAVPGNWGARRLPVRLQSRSA